MNGLDKADGMNEWVRLVIGMTPPGRRYVVGTALARDRFVLLTLAYLADENGEARVSLATLHAVTLHSVNLIRTSIRSWMARGVLIRTRAADQPGPNHYQLVREALNSLQLTAVAHDTDSVVILEQLGVDIRSVNALARADIHTMRELGERIRQFQDLPEGRHEKKFHLFLDTRGLGAMTGEKIMLAYEQWQANRPNADHLDGCTDADMGAARNREVAG